MDVVDPIPTKRAERVQSPSVTLPFRSPEGSITNVDVWREDILEWKPDARFPSQWYLVLDFGTEQEAITTINVIGTNTGVDHVDTGRIQLDLQPLKIDTLADWDPETGEGLGPPVVRFADVPTDEIGDMVGDEPTVGRPMVGWIPHPVSPRRDRQVRSGT